MFSAKCTPCLCLFTNHRTNVFIPNYFVRFGTQKTKPLGIGYADLPSREVAESVVSDLNGAYFKDRKIHVGYHEPFSPSPRFSRFKGGSFRRATRVAKSPGTFPVEAPATAPVETVAESPEHEATPGEEEKPDFQYSETTIFIRGIRQKASVERLTEFFSEYGPAEVKIIKPNGFINGLRHRANNALVSFKPSADLSLDKIVENCKERVFEGYVLNVAKAFKLRDKHGEEATKADGPKEEVAEAAPELPERPDGAEEAAPVIEGEAEEAPAAEEAKE